jgi:uncharacterized membrane protein
VSRRDTPLSPSQQRGNIVESYPAKVRGKERRKREVIEHCHLRSRNARRVPSTYRATLLDDDTETSICRIQQVIAVLRTKLNAKGITDCIADIAEYLASLGAIDAPPNKNASASDCNKKRNYVPLMNTRAILNAHTLGITHKQIGIGIEWLGATLRRRKTNKHKSADYVARNS